ncbi:MAG: CCA tRNA nucleotidyltransferase [Oscillospiraceae bacterium]|nr:CCA tRNA nucleotidyltransferase [Oscillospiraceae bacterium]
MELPGYVLELMQKLNGAGFQAWVVGGCVRDSLLCKTPQDWDLCTDAKPEEMLSIFADFRLLTQGLKHGTITVLSDSPVEITTFRTEGGYADHRHPGWVAFVPDIRLDLARRDFTVNAMAYCPALGFADPFGGQQDLQSKLLRAVGEPETRFQEDGLRILRGARFCAAYDLTPEHATYEAMRSQRQLLDGLSRERVYSELCKFLLAAKVEDLERFAPILTQVLPELAPTVGFLQQNPHHVFDVYGHTAHVVAVCPAELPLRWAALLHDVGKPQCFHVDEKGVGHFPGHAQVGAELAASILARLRAPKAMTEQVATLVRYHSTCRQAKGKTVRRLLRKLGETTLRQLLALDKADGWGKQPGESREVSPEIREFEEELERILAESPCLTLRQLAINGHDLQAIGVLPGRAMGSFLAFLLEQVEVGAVENEKEALLQIAKSRLKDA